MKTDTTRLKKYMADKCGRVDEALRECLVPPDEMTADLYEYMSYSVFARGKRLRPVLAMAASEACGGTAETAMPAACAVELIHAYSLIHDDLPCMDDSDLRRGRPSSHKKFGEPNALLAGDALQALAFEVLGRASETAGVDPAVAARACACIARAAGAAGMAGGQMLDLRYEDSSVSLETLKGIHARKTGALIAVSLEAGAILANADEAQIESLVEYGKYLGLSFQITDDILDVTSDAETMGKPVGADDARDKSTYPALLGLEKAREMARECGENAAQALESFGERAAILAELVDYVVNRTH
ncbi:polyprenyl synthetase family protein [Candidatus Hydrogenedentota bacterium]